MLIIKNSLAVAAEAGWYAVPYPVVIVVLGQEQNARPCHPSSLAGPPKVSSARRPGGWGAGSGEFHDRGGSAPHRAADAPGSCSAGPGGPPRNPGPKGAGPRSLGRPGPGPPQPGQPPASDCRWAS